MARRNRTTRRTGNQADAMGPGAPPRAPVSLGEVDDYLYNVYQRTPVKRDSSGDFSDKDPRAATRMGLDVKTYAIQGMQPQFRELLYRAGKEMDAAGLEWSMSAGFRDNYRQQIASGFKAMNPGNSKHGGSNATKGYGDGQAIDITGSGKTSNEEVWRWIDKNGAKFGLLRPISRKDPPHTQMRPNAPQLAAKFSEERLRLAEAQAQKESKNTPERKMLGAAGSSGAVFGQAAEAATTPTPEAETGVWNGIKSTLWAVAEPFMSSKTKTAEGVTVESAGTPAPKEMASAAPAKPQVDAAAAKPVPAGLPPRSRYASTKP